MDLRHAHIQVKDMKKARQFYESFLGFSEDFICDENEIFLKNKFGFVLGIDRKENPEILPSWFHFGFSCQSEAEIRECHQSFIERGVKISRELSTYGNGDMNFYVHDPDGHSIEIYFNQN